MSLIFTRQVVGTISSDILTHRSKIPAVNASSMYKTEMDLGLVRPHAQNPFRLVPMDSIPGPSRENSPAACVISPTDNSPGAVESSMSAPSEGNHDENQVKVETESVGKISDLITRFNGVESRALDIKIPAKRFRIDLQNVHTSYDTSGEDTNGSHPVQGDEVPLIQGSESSKLPVVQMKFKLHTQTVNRKDAIVESNIPTGHKQLRVLKIPPPPAPKPLLTKTCGLPTAAICPPNTEPSEIHCVRPSELRKVFPVAHIKFPRTDKSGVVRKTREYENGRNTYFQSGVSASQCNQSEHKLIQCQHRDTADNSDMLPTGICEEHTSYHEDESLSTDNPHEETVKESITFSMEDKQQMATAIEERLAVSAVKNQQKATLMKETLTVSLEGKQKNAVAMKPTISPRHTDINTHMPDTSRKVVTKDDTPVLVVTLDMADDGCTTLSKGSQVTPSDMASGTFCCDSMVMEAEEGWDLRKHIDDRDVQSHDNGHVTVKNEMKDFVISNQAGNMSKSGDSRHGNMTDTHRLVFGCVDRTTCTDSSVACCTTSTDSNVGHCTAVTDTTGGNTYMDANVVGCPTSTNSNVRCCTTSTDSGVHGCTTSIDASIDVCRSSTECSVDGYPTSSEPIVNGCKISTEPSARGFTPSTDSTRSEYSISTDPTVSECPTSTDSTVSERPTSTSSTVSECPTSTSSTVSECPTSTSSTESECPTSTSSTESEYPTSTSSTVSECPARTHPSVAGQQQKGHNTDRNTISAKLDMLKTELMAMRKMDLVLLRQLINISQAIQRIQRSDLPKMSRSLTILSSKKTLQPRFKPVERQNSAPHCADRRRFLFSNAKWRTEDDYRDSLSSFEESSFDSQSELEESSSSLNNTLSSPRSFDCPRILFQSCNIPLSLDISEEVDQSYEDILSRNVRLWKMGFQRHQSVQEKVDVWF